MDQELNTFADVERFVSTFLRSATDLSINTLQLYNFSAFLEPINPNLTLKKVYDLSSVSTKRILKIHVGEEMECAICLDHFRLRQKVYKLKCNHMFHTQCGKIWLTEKGTCPTCRGTI